MDGNMMKDDFVLKINRQDLQVMVACIHSAPHAYKETAPLLIKLQGQINEQEAAANETQPSAGALEGN